jgi:hypothetical protein
MPRSVQQTDSKMLRFGVKTQSWNCVRFVKRDEFTHLTKISLTPLVLIEHTFDHAEFKGSNRLLCKRDLGGCHSH